MIVKKFTDMAQQAHRLLTRFIATHECDASLAYKERYLNVKPEDIVLIKSTVGMPGRALRSPFVERLLRGEKKKLPVVWYVCGLVTTESGSLLYYHSADRSGKRQLGRWIVFLWQQRLPHERDCSRKGHYR